MLHRAEGWSDALVSGHREDTRSNRSRTPNEEAETMRSTLEREAALGRTCSDASRPDNARTSVLGNSELLLLEPGDLPPTMISQAWLIPKYGSI